MPTNNNVECPVCTPSHCLGPTIHTLYATITTSTAPRSLAHLLNCSPSQLPTLNGVDLLHTLNQLTCSELVNLSRATGLPHEALIHLHDTEPTNTTTDNTARRAQLIALVLANHPTGCHPEDLAHHLNWPLTTVYTTIHTIIEHQPEGQRLRITGDGHLVLRPDNTCHPTITTTLNPPTKPHFRLTPDLATSLWHLCHHNNTTPIPDHHTTTLHTAGLLTADGPQFHPTIDVTHSLQFY